MSQSPADYLRALDRAATPGPGSPEWQAKERELAAQVHEMYLETARRYHWPIRPEVNVPFDKLSIAAKALDLMIAKWHLLKLRDDPLRTLLPALADVVEWAMQVKDLENKVYFESCAYDHFTPRLRELQQELAKTKSAMESILNRLAAAVAAVEQEKK